MKNVMIVLALVSSMSAYAQRVSQITEIRHNTLFRPQPDTIISDYQYQDTLLSRVVITKNGKVDDTYDFLYKKNRITVKSTRQGGMVKSFTYNKESGLLEEYWNDPKDRYNFVYEESRIQSFKQEDTYDKYVSGNSLVYENGQLIRLKTWNEKAGPAHSTDYVVTYDHDKVTKVVLGNNIDTYDLIWENDRVINIVHTKFSEPDWRHEFVYDPSGRIFKELNYTLGEGEEKLRDELK